jgi:hypothetical protein
MTWRVLVSLCGVAVIGAATHANVLHAGGYGTEAAPLIIAMAALLTFGMGFVGLLWSERRLRAAIGLAVCILAGEVSGSASTPNARSPSASTRRCRPRRRERGARPPRNGLRKPHPQSAPLTQPPQRKLPSPAARSTALSCFPLASYVQRRRWPKLEPRWRRYRSPKRSTAFQCA